MRRERGGEEGVHCREGGEEEYMEGEKREGRRSLCAN